ncbi:MAG: DUF58 domain-containing protein [Oligoflexus sp.]|nr:DUF58 domain-containing protein [Oligoflexus sp.]
MKKKTYLSGKAFALLGAWQLLGTVALLYGPALWLYAAAIPCIGLLLYWDRKRLPRREEWSITFKGQSTIRLHEKQVWTWQLGLAEFRQVAKVTFHFPFLPLYRSNHEAVPLGADFRQTIIHQNVSGFQLGQETISSVFVLVVSRAAFWKQLLEISVAPLPVHCKPSLAKVPPEHLAAALQRLQSLFHGSRQLLKQRSRDQFHSIREYRHEDDIRNIDPRKSAKKGQLMIREYDSLIQHHLVIGLDLGRSLTGLMNGSQKTHYYLEGIIALLQKAIAANDKVSFFAFNQDIVVIRKNIRSIRGIREILDLEGQLIAEDVESDYNLIGEALSHIDQQRCIVLILSDIARPAVQTELLKAMRQIAGKHLSMTMGILDKESDFRQNEILPVPVVNSGDAWAKDVYVYWLEQEFQEFAQRMIQIRSGAVLCPEHFWLDMSSKLYMRLRDSLLI